MPSGLMKVVDATARGSMLELSRGMSREQQRRLPVLCGVTVSPFRPAYPG